MKSRTYTGWAVKFQFPGCPPQLANVCEFGDPPPSHLAVMERAVFKTKAQAQNSINSLPWAIGWTEPVKVKIKFEVIT